MAEDKLWRELAPDIDAGKVHGAIPIILTCDDAEEADVTAAVLAMRHAALCQLAEDGRTWRLTAAGHNAYPQPAPGSDGDTRDWLVPDA